VSFQRYTVYVNIVNSAYYLAFATNHNQQNSFASVLFVLSVHKPSAIKKRNCVSLKLIVRCDPLPKLVLYR